MGIAVGISLISCLGAEIHAFEVWRPPSWIFPLPVQSHRIRIILSGMLDLDNVSWGVGISVISCWLPGLEAEIHAVEVFGHHFGRFHFRLSHTVFPYISMERWPQNIDDAVRISLTSRMWAEMKRLFSWFFFILLQFSVWRPPYWNYGWW